MPHDLRSHLFYRLTATLTVLLSACDAASHEDAPPPSNPAEVPGVISVRGAQVCIVRHAEAFKNLTPRPKGLSPEQLDSLTPTGEAQARALRDALPSKVSTVAASPLGRARRTAELLSTNTPTVEQALRPLDGDVAWDARVAAWANGQDPTPEGGESLADGERRVGALLQRVQATQHPGEAVVLVTHGDIASLLLGHLRGTPLLQRPTQDTLGTGEMLCLPMPLAAEKTTAEKTTR